MIFNGGVYEILTAFLQNTPSIILVFLIVYLFYAIARGFAPIITLLLGENFK